MDTSYPHFLYPRVHILYGGGHSLRRCYGGVDRHVSIVLARLGMGARLDGYHPQRRRVGVVAVLIATVLNILE